MDIYAFKNLQNLAKMSSLKNIFLIEDDEHDQDMFAYMLKFIHEVVLQDIASDGREALNKLETAITLPDLIFTDIHMPVMDGIECLAAIQGSPILSMIPVIVLSSDISRLDLIRRMGARAFIRKTGDINALAYQIGRFIHLDYVKDIDIANETFKIRH